MENPTPPSGSSPSVSRYFYLNNWISLVGAVIAVCALFSFLLLFAIDLGTGSSNPYVGILTYLASPAFFILGLGMMLVGWMIHRRQIAHSRTGESALTFSFDFSQPRHRRNFVIFTAGTFIFLIISAVGSYKTYHFTESVEFCGLICHPVMEPVYVTHQLGAHARISCAECHIGEGATWFVKSKISGLYQVYSTLFDKYSRPIPVPVHSLRPAQETCEQCHWPQKFTGNLDRVYPRYLADDENTPYHVRLSLNVGGGDPRRGPVGGIHWHMSVANKVEYIATDPQRQEIPWVRVTSPDGEVVEYHVPDFDESLLTHHQVRVMDCMDCHNRPAHVFLSPNEAIDRALYIGRLDRQMPGIKRLALELLTAEYVSRDEALSAIDAGLEAAYPDDPRLAGATAEIQDIYRSNFFPEMRVSWEAFPNNISHKDWTGCFRCHSNEHNSADGRRITPMSDCNTCHTILAQGSTEEELRILHPDGDRFRHPGGPVGGFLCNDCHYGGPLD